MSDIRKKRLKPKPIDIDKYFFPILITVVCFIFGIWYLIDSSNYLPAASGIVEGKLLSVASKSQGYVLQTFVDEGQEVRKGDLLVELDPTDYEYKLQQAEDKIRNLKIKLNNPNYKGEDSKLNKFYPEIKQKKSMFGFSQKDFENFSKMFDNNEQQVQQKQNNIEQQEQVSIDSADEEKKELTEEEIIAEIKRLEALIEQLKLNISYTKIHAPQDGKISVRQVRIGDYVEVAQNVVTIIPKRVWISAKYSIEQLDNIKEGQDVIVKIHTYPNRKFKGVVDYVPNLESKSCGDNSKVRIMFTEDYSEYNIAPGTSVQVRTKIK